MKIITNITGTVSDSTIALTPYRPGTPSNLLKRFCAEGLVLVDGQKNEVLFPWTELEKAAAAIPSTVTPAAPVHPTDAAQ